MVGFTECVSNVKFRLLRQGEHAKLLSMDQKEKAVLKSWYQQIGSKGGKAKSPRKTLANTANARKRWANRVCEKSIVDSQDSCCGAK